MSAWITPRDAAARLGLTKSAIAKMVRSGKLTAGPRLGRLLTVDEAQVAAYRAHVPPDDFYVWPTASQAARLVGITKQAMNRRCAADKVPSTFHDGRRWIRRDQLAMIEKAHAVRDGVEPPTWVWTA